MPFASIRFASPRCASLLRSWRRSPDTVPLLRPHARHLAGHVPRPSKLVLPRRQPHFFLFEKTARRCFAANADGSGALPHSTTAPHSLKAEHVEYFRTILPGSSVLFAGLDNAGKEAHPSATIEELAPYNTDWMRKYRGASRLVLKPSSTEEVAKILQYCHEQELPLVPQGGK